MKSKHYTKIIFDDLADPREKNRKRSMSELKAFCRKNYGQGWRKKYLSLWKARRRREKIKNQTERKKP